MHNQLVLSSRSGHVAGVSLRTSTEHVYVFLHVGNRQELEKWVVAHFVPNAMSLVGKFWTYKIPPSLRLGKHIWYLSLSYFPLCQMKMLFVRRIKCMPPLEHWRLLWKLKSFWDL